MTESEAIELIADLAEAYPRAKFPIESQQMYAQKILDLPYLECQAVIEGCISNDDQLPSIAKLRRSTRLSQAPGGSVLWSDEWSRVLEAAGTRGRDRQPAWSDPRTRAAVRAIGWVNLCKCYQRDLPTIRAQFRDIWNNNSERIVRSVSTHKGELLPATQENGQLPPGVAALTKRLKP